MSSIMNGESGLKMEKLPLEEKHSPHKRAVDAESEEQQLEAQREISETIINVSKRPNSGEGLRIIPPSFLTASGSVAASISHNHPTFADALNSISHKPLDLSYPKFNSLHPYRLYSHPTHMPGSHLGIPHYPFGDTVPMSAAAAVAAYGSYPMYHGLTESSMNSSSIKFPLSSLLRKRRNSESSSHQSSQSSQDSPPVKSSVSVPELQDESNNDDDTGSSIKKARSVPEEKKDAAYWERRRKNNDAAKRSRDARRAKEEEIALRAAFLEQENMKLRAEVSILKNELARLHYMVYSC
ncbi:uncharacterized protein LOC100374756 [Saccoglossus kowalevskii]|uniref:Cell death specification protein 2-like n=1 Tax=Saccoglossus kowalevskii TaxID=10224 RepID=A0A0U2L608_SACKO|nr:PREDICTED: cell death specification protein 2-like [Saccoglossus kowalevskii]ALR88697.1 giant transcription factor-like 140 [Saccoglossus kowalevskii]